MDETGLGVRRTDYVCVCNRESKVEEILSTSLTVRQLIKAIYTTILTNRGESVWNSYEL